MEDRFKDDRIRKAFGDSQKNPFEEVERQNANHEISAMIEAKKLNEYMKTDNFEKVETKGINITTRNGVLTFQSTNVKFINDFGESCSTDISVPTNFSGEIRVWTEDFSGRKVWSTVNKIYESECNKNMLFDFLGKYTHRFSIDEMSDDLPF